MRYSLVINALLIGAIAAATCTFKTSYYSSTDCSGTASPLEGSNLPIGTVNDDTLTSAGSYVLQIMACDPDGVIQIATYASGTTSPKATAIARSGSTTYTGMGGIWAKGLKCYTPWLLTTGGSYKTTEVSVFGNKFGIGWIDGYGVFFCATLLFGLC